MVLRCINSALPPLQIDIISERKRNFWERGEGRWKGDERARGERGREGGGKRGGAKDTIAWGRVPIATVNTTYINVIKTEITM